MSQYIPYTVNAGNGKLSQYRAASIASKKAIERFCKQSRAGTTEAPVSFRLNRTGNIFYAVTGDGHLQEKTKELFDTVIVHFCG